MKFIHADYFTVDLGDGPGGSLREVTVDLSNEKNIFDLRLFAKDAGWIYKTMLIWNKHDARARPLGPVINKFR